MDSVKLMGIYYKRNLHGVSDTGTRVYVLRSETHDLSEDLGRQEIGKVNCGAEC